MSKGYVTADWAWMSKRPGSIEYGVVAASADVDGYIRRYVTGAPNSSFPPDSPGGVPWVTFGPFTNTAEPLFSITVLDQQDERDHAGRQIFPSRFFLLRYRDIAVAGASYQRLWETIGKVKLPANDQQPLVLSIQSQPVDELATAVEQYGIERVSIIAALLLDGEPIVLTDSATLPRDERLAVLDAVLALLPFGFRAGLSASTSVDNTISHVIDLVFAEYANNRQVPVSLANSAHVPMPNTKLGQDYLGLLREKIAANGLEAVIRHLWAANEALPLTRAPDAPRLLSELPVAPAAREPIRQDKPDAGITIAAEDAARISAIAEDAARITAIAEAHNRVQFSASYSDVLRLGVRQPLYVHVYHDGIRDQLDTRLAELADRLGPQRHRSEGSANTIIAQGAKLEIQPLIANVRCYPARRTIRWRDRFREAYFKIECSNDSIVGSRSVGSVAISTQGSLIAQLPISVEISARSAAAPPLKTVMTDMIQQVFGSYAHEDADLVTRFRATYEALGIFLFLDTLDIPVGAMWEQYLEQQIELSDVFQLFWSRASAESQAVENEWRYALAVSDKRPPGTRFIRPVYWTKPCPEPPEQLAGIHFRYFDPGAFSLGPEGTSSENTRLINRLVKMVRSFRGR